MSRSRSGSVATARSSRLRVSFASACSAGLSACSSIIAVDCSPAAMSSKLTTAVAAPLALSTPLETAHRARRGSQSCCRSASTIAPRIRMRAYHSNAGPSLPPFLRSASISPTVPAAIRSSRPTFEGSLRRKRRTVCCTSGKYASIDSRETGRGSGATGVGSATGASSGSNAGATDGGTSERRAGAFERGAGTREGAALMVGVSGAGSLSPFAAPGPARKTTRFKVFSRNVGPPMGHSRPPQPPASSRPFLLQPLGKSTLPID
jgi:hypothetical protein